LSVTHNFPFVKREKENSGNHHGSPELYGLIFDKAVQDILIKGGKAQITNGSAGFTLGKQNVCLVKELYQSFLAVGL
jgi:hypothetical protein